MRIVVCLDFIFDIFIFFYLGFRQLSVLDMSLTVRLSVSCCCSCIVCNMLSEINDDEVNERTHRPLCGPGSAVGLLCVCVERNDI